MQLPKGLDPPQLIQATHVGSRVGARFLNSAGLREQNFKQRHVRCKTNESSGSSDRGGSPQTTDIRESRIGVGGLLDLLRTGKTGVSVWVLEQLRSLGRELNPKNLELTQVFRDQGKIKVFRTEPIDDQGRWTSGRISRSGAPV